MPIMKCQVDGRPGFKYGNRGKCYTYDDDDDDDSHGLAKKAAKLRAMKQGKAIRSGGSYGRNG